MFLLLITNKKAKRDASLPGRFKSRAWLIGHTWYASQGITLTTLDLGDVGDAVEMPNRRIASPDENLQKNVSFFSPSNTVSWRQLGMPYTTLG